MSKVGKTWFARFAGIIDAVLGCLALLGGIILSPRILGQTARMPGFNIFVFVVIILPLFVFGILSIVGSVFNIITKRWRLALTGSISSLIVVAFLSLSATEVEYHPALGILAILLSTIGIVFTSITRREFK